MGRNRILMAAALWFVCAGSLFAEVDRYMVFFKDKNNSKYSLQRPEEFLSSKAVERRIRYKIPFTKSDLPVKDQYIDSLTSLGLNVFYHTKWLNGALVEGTDSLIAILEEKPFISRIEMAARGPLGFTRRGFLFRSITINSVKESLPTNIQNKMIGVDLMHEAGYRGENMNVAVFDGGFLNVNKIDVFAHLFEEGRVSAGYNFIDNNDSVFQYDDHGTNVLSCMAAYDPELYIGTAYKANYSLYVTEDINTEYRIEEYNWLFAAERADSAGVDVINSSLGYNLFDDESMNYSHENLDGKSAVITQAAALAARKGILVVVSAGNEGNNGWKYIVPPADADSILTVGAVDETLRLAYFSSIGPENDDRIKPDLVALGQNTQIVSLTGSVKGGNGTSFAAPLVAGLATGFWQANPHLSAIEVIRMLKNSATQAKNPDDLLGFGAPDFRKALASAGRVQKDIVVFPNPTDRNLFSIRLSPNYAVISPEVEMFNMSGDLVGRMVMKKKNNPFTQAQEFEVNLPDIPSGAYILAIAADHVVNKVKIVKN